MFMATALCSQNTIEGYELKLSKLGSENTEDIIQLREEFAQFISDSIALLGNDNADTLNMDAVISKIDKDIAELYYKQLTTKDAEKKSDVYTKLMQLLKVKEFIEGNSETSDLKVDHAQTKESLQALLENNNLALSQIKKENSANISQKEEVKEIKAKAEKEKEEPEVFNTTSIIKQIVAASLDQGNPYVIDPSVDAKGFEDRKAFMARPLDNSDIMRKYNSKLENVLIQSSDNLVKSISQGEVIYVKRLGGINYTVVLKHDNGYFSVYSNLDRPVVTLGQKLRYQEFLGYAKQVGNGNYTMELQILKGNQSLNPSHWLKNG